MEIVFWIAGGLFVGYVVWVLMTSDGKRRTGKNRSDKGGAGWFGGGWDGNGGDGGGGGD